MCCGLVSAQARQRIVSYLLEEMFVASFVGMVFHGQLAVGLSDFLGVRRFFHLFLQGKTKSQKNNVPRGE